MSDEIITDPEWRKKIKSKVTSKKTQDLLADCSSKLNGPDCVTLINRIFENETSLRLFVQTLLAMDLAEAKSGNMDQYRPFILVAQRIAYVYFSQAQVKTVKPEETAEFVVRPVPDGK